METKKIKPGMFFEQQRTFLIVRQNQTPLMAENGWIGRAVSADRKKREDENSHRRRIFRPNSAPTMASFGIHQRRRERGRIAGGWLQWVVLQNKRLKTKRGDGSATS